MFGERPFALGAMTCRWAVLQTLEQGFPPVYVGTQLFGGATRLGMARWPALRVARRGCSQAGCCDGSRVWFVCSCVFGQVAYDVRHAVAAAREAGIVGAEAFLQERLGDLAAAGRLYLLGVKE